MVYGDDTGSDSFAVDFGIKKEFNTSINVVFYFIDYSKRYHSSLHDDIEVLTAGFSIRFPFYLTATMASWASHIRSLDKKERIKAMRKIFFKEKKKPKKKKGVKGGGNK